MNTLYICTFFNNGFKCYTEYTKQQIEVTFLTDFIRIPQVLLVIEGKAHAYVFASPGCKKWDTCAPEAVLHAAGGKLTDIHGNYYQYQGTVQRRNLGGVLAVPQVCILGQ